MQTNTVGPNYSGIGSNNFNKRQLFEIIRLREKAGKVPKKSISLKELNETPRTQLVIEANRMRQDKTWYELYTNKKIASYATV